MSFTTSHLSQVYQTYPQAYQVIPEIKYVLVSSIRLERRNGHLMGHCFTEPPHNDAIECWDFNWCPADWTGQDALFKAPIPVTIKKQYRRWIIVSSE